MVYILYTPIKFLTYLQYNNAIYGHEHVHFRNQCFLIAIIYHKMHTHHNYLMVKKGFIVI